MVKAESKESKESMAAGEKGGEAAAGKEKKEEEGKLATLENGEKIKNYEVRAKLGEGGYGAVYEVIYQGPGVRRGQKYAMKIESAKEALQTLKMEVLVLQALEAAQSKHACRMVEGGQNERFRFVIMTMVGPSLQNLRKERKTQCFTLPTAIRTGRQCLEALKNVHDAGFLHRDIKPGNFAIGIRSETAPDGARIVYILDFGIARKYLDDSGEVRKPRKRAGFRGTLRYAPLACHNQKELGRKDDLETWLYMLVELNTGRVPWRELTTKAEVGRAKEEARTPAGKAALFAKCPKPYTAFLDWLDTTPVSAAPPYQKILDALSGVMTAEAITNDAPYDWELAAGRTAASTGGRRRSASKDLKLPGPNKPQAKTKPGPKPKGTH